MAYISKNKEIGIVIEKVSKAKSEKDFDEICMLLEDIYTIEGKTNSNFRHEYSFISGKINELSQQEECDLNQLISNMDFLYSRCLENGKEYINNLFKLKDHLNLEVFRMQYADKKEDDLQANLLKYQNDVNQFTTILDREEKVIERIISSQNDIERKNDDLSKTQSDIQKKNTDISNAQEKLSDQAEELSKRLKDNMAQFVSILGIFAAILLAFISGIVFTNSVLNNIDKASIYRILMVMAIIGIVMYNSIYILLRFIEKFTYNRDRVGFGKSWIAVNVILIIIMICVCACWTIGAVEWRNEIIDNRCFIEETESEK